jgi:AdoMet-dependent heme synthase
MHFDVDLDQSPLLVIWEVTRACALACKHCRASAIDWRDPNELSTDEGYQLLDEIKAMGTPVVVFTGGDPLQRPDLEDLIRHAKQLGLRTGTIPAATPRLTRERLQSIRDAGIDQVAFSLDAPTAERHDDFRQVPGAFALAMQGMAWTRELGIPLQINTVFTRWNMDDFDALAEKVRAAGAVFWEVFFLVPTGRGESLQGCNAEETEALFAKLHQLAGESDFVIKVTEAPHYRRFLMQQGQSRHDAMRAQSKGGRGLTVTRGGINAGKGFAFIDHVGEAFPSGFLPLPCGNVRQHPLRTIYREHPTFTSLRNPDLLGGRCGHCGFRQVCGGSRARAYALTGDAFASDPTCILTLEPAAKST